MKIKNKYNMNFFSLKKIYLLAVIFCLFPCGLFAYEMDECILCHTDNSGEGIPQMSLDDYRSSVHGGMMECTVCHSYIEEGHEGGDVTGRVNCGNCHSHENLHGLSSGKDNKPECYTCHTTHKILPESAENSSINILQFKNTCRKCHPAKWGEQGYMKWFTSFRVKSHKKQDFSRDFDETNCIGCHQGMAVHGTPDKISDDECFKCHMKDNKNAMIGKFHAADNSLSSITGFSIITQILILMILIFAVRFFIKPLRKSGKGKE